MTIKSSFHTVSARSATRSFGRRGARRRGQALVEFALIAGIFSLMLLGLIQFGIYQSTSNTLWNLSREGARFATVSNPTDEAIKNHVLQVAPSTIDNAKLVVEITPKTTRVSGQPVKVNLTYDMESKLIFPLIKPLFYRERVIPAKPAQGGEPATQETTVSGYPYSTVSTMRVE